MVDWQSESDLDSIRNSCDVLIYMGRAWLMMMAIKTAMASIKIMLLMLAMMIITVWRALWCVHGSQYQAITREAAYIFIRHHKTMIKWQESLYGYRTQVRSLSTLVTHRLTHCWLTLGNRSNDGRRFSIWGLVNVLRLIWAHVRTAHIFSQSAKCIRILYRPHKPHICVFSAYSDIRINRISVRFFNADMRL